MNKQITFSIALAFVLIVSIVSVSAGVSSWITEKNFTIKKETLSTSGIYLKDSVKVVKDKKCLKDKEKYATISLEDTEYFYENVDGLVRFSNE